MSTEYEDYDGQLVEEYLRYLRGQGTRPRTDHLSDRERGRHEQLFQLLEAIVDADAVEMPPMEKDPVAIRLGLIRDGEETSTKGEEPHDLSDLPERIASSLVELVHRFRGEIEVTPMGVGDAATTYKSNGLRVLAECRSLGELVLVCSTPSGEFTELPGTVAHLFIAHQLVDAVVVASTISNDAVVLTQADCLRAIDPKTGWVNPALPALPEPLELALGRHLERSLPRWDEIAKLDAVLVLADADEEVAASVRESLSMKRTAQIPAKKRALAEIDGLSAKPFEDLLRDVRAGRLAGKDLIQRLREISEAVIR